MKHKDKTTRRFRQVITETAARKLTSEMSEDELTNGDFERDFDTIVIQAREALGKVTLPRTCQARQFSDSMVCNRCNLDWDMSDPEPPQCRPLQ